MPAKPFVDSDPLWFKDAIIYQLHVKTFFDSNDDGYGDFAGLVQKLDYIEELGVNCLWLLPFYPSPLKDDGYDISDYRGIHPIYGDRRDFRTFIREAHRRGIRVITELVVNHTSDQHPWFQAARQAPPRSVKRNYYVWSNSDKKYKNARIIFTDSEKSNWTWDPVAKAFYWHRFFHHQPDLNFDNPHVRRAVLRIMRFWLDQGVDGLRLDAVPYLIEREGTNCENLPETHEVIKEWRKEIDEHYEGRILLAEANQWPQDVVKYFGDGDECHMAYHFPLMPRIFMALHREESHPIIDIMERTPPIPDNCQWAIFLRNHDELTLEMVTDEEREYMYKAYAQDSLMRINVGIRRRLAPLLLYSRPRIELVNSLLLSLPGTPIIYYGDEIGMGENIYLTDRNTVRTPMQWNGDRNGGFSRALFARLYSPPNMDPVTGYQAINVEQQSLDPSSLLHWMRNIIRMRKQHKVFGRGTVEFLKPANGKVLAYIRRFEDQIALVVANLSRYPQAVELDLSAYQGIAPIEMFGLGEFPVIRETPYALTLGAHSFYWFQLQTFCQTLHVPAPLKEREEVAPPPTPAELVAGIPTFRVDVSTGWEELFTGSFRSVLESDVLPSFIKAQHWPGITMQDIASVGLVDWVSIPDGADGNFILLVRLDDSLYSMCLSVATGLRADELLRSNPEAVAAKLSIDGATGLLFDGLCSDRFCHRLFELIRAEDKLTGHAGRLTAFSTAAFEKLEEAEKEALSVRRSQTEQSNPSVIYSDRVILKMFRRLQAGTNPDLEIGLYLTDRAQFRTTPKVYGAIEYRSDRLRDPITLALMHEFVPNQGDAWTYTLEELRRFFERCSAHMYLLDKMHKVTLSPFRLVDQEIPAEIEGLLGIYLRESALLGTRTAEMHAALAQGHEDPSFKPKRFSRFELSELFASLQKGIDTTLADLRHALESMPPELLEPVQSLLSLSEKARELIGDAGSITTSVPKIRCHGDYDLSEVLRVSGDYFTIDFEGDAGKPVAERLRKHTPIKDVASMLHSYSYATFASLFVFTHNRPEELGRFLPWARLCQGSIMAAFLKGYLAAASAGEFLPESMTDFEQILGALLIDKAFANVDFDLRNRPEWLKISLYSALELVAAASESMAMKRY